MRLPSESGICRARWTSLHFHETTGRILTLNHRRALFRSGVARTSTIHLPSCCNGPSTLMTGLSQEQLDLLVDRIADLASPWRPPRGRHRTLSLAAAVTMTLVWLRHNPSQALLGAFYGISQPTVSRIITGLREPIMRVAVQGMPGLAETAPTERLLLDGTLLPTGNRAGQQGQGLYSGKRHKAGMNLQVISDPWGRLLATSDPTPGGDGAMRGRLR
jgi:hypothetical protein